MKEKDNIVEQIDFKNVPRNNVVWVMLIPQFIILSLSTVWIFFFPDDNVIKYFNFDLKFILIGLGIAVVLACSGFGFYKFSAFFREKSRVLDNLAFYFEEMLSPFIKKLSPLDVLIVSTVAGFSEEILFRGLLCLKLGIIISSIGFGLLHIPTSKYGKVYIYAIWATLSGILLGWLFTTYSNLTFVIVIHIINNIIGMIFLKNINTKRDK